MEKSDQIAPQSLGADSHSNTHRLLGDAECVLGNDGGTYIVVDRGPIKLALRSGSSQFNNYIQDQARRLGEPLPRRAELSELDYVVRSIAESHRNRVDVWLRVASIPGGIEVDLGDASGMRVEITDAGVALKDGSSTVFQRTLFMKPLTAPASDGDLDLLYKYLPEHPPLRMMLLAFITYVIAHPKQEQTKYVILVLTGEHGSGKSFVSKLIQRIVDPSVATAQVLPRDPKELAIATKSAHLAVFDNIRSFSPQMADALCIASTGGSITGRQLYTDSEQQLVQLHGAVILNGLHHFVDQPDLAQRCLVVNLPERKKSQLREEGELEAQLNADMPQIMRGVYDLTAKILKAQRMAQVQFPHRMMGFVRWLSALEDVVGFSFLQEYFVRMQAQGQREALEENIFSATVLAFAESQKQWVGTPAALLAQLTETVPELVRRSRDWPQNAVALSKRLIPLQPALREQGIELKIDRAKERRISINKAGVF